MSRSLFSYFSISYSLLATLSLLVLLTPSAFIHAETKTDSVSLQSATLFKIGELKKQVEKYQNMQLAIVNPVMASTSNALKARQVGSSIIIWNKDQINFEIKYDVTAKERDVYIMDFRQQTPAFDVLDINKQLVGGTYATMTIRTNAIAQKGGGFGSMVYLVPKGTTQRFTVNAVFKPNVSVENALQFHINQIFYYTDEPNTAGRILFVDYATYPIMWRASGY